MCVSSPWTPAVRCWVWKRRSRNPRRRRRGERSDSCNPRHPNKQARTHTHTHPTHKHIKWCHVWSWTNMPPLPCSCPQIWRKRRSCPALQTPHASSQTQTLATRSLPGERRTTSRCSGCRWERHIWDILLGGVRCPCQHRLVNHLDLKWRSCPASNVSGSVDSHSIDFHTMSQVPVCANYCLKSQTAFVDRDCSIADLSELEESRDAVDQWWNNGVFMVCVAYAGLFVGGSRLLIGQPSVFRHRSPAGWSLPQRHNASLVPRPGPEKSHLELHPLHAGD